MFSRRERSTDHRVAAAGCQQPPRRTRGRRLAHVKMQRLPFKRQLEYSCRSERLYTSFIRYMPVCQFLIGNSVDLLKKKFLTLNEVD